MSILNTSRRIYQQLVLLSLLFVVLSVIIVFVKLINVVFHVEIIIIIIVIRKHLFVLILYFSMCCHDYIRRKKRKQNLIHFIFLYRHIKHLSPNRSDIERTIAQTRNKEQSRSLPRIPLSVWNFYFILVLVLMKSFIIEPTYKFKSWSW